MYTLDSVFKNIVAQWKKYGGELHWQEMLCRFITAKGVCRFERSCCMQTHPKDLGDSDFPS